MNWIRINNRSNFLLEEIPNYHPASAKYINFWRGEKKKIIEGYWGPDDEKIKNYIVKENSYDINTDKWRFMPPQLYFYVNYGTILHNKVGEPTTAPKHKMRPSLRDVEWEFFYNWIEARGFSGFSEDDIYTSNLAVKEYNDGYEESLLDKTCYNIDGKLKKFIPAREYLRKLFDRPFGVPLYMNQAKNLFLLGSRGGGKSYQTAIGVVLHELITDGAKEYNRYSIENPATIEVFVGAAVSSKSSDLLKKTQISFKEMPGVWMKDTMEEIPNPLFKEMSGSLEPNNIKNPWRHEYLIKVNGRWKTKGSGSNVKHGIYTIENPEAAAGTRPGVMVVEEVGLLSNLLLVHASNEFCQLEGTIKFGSTIYLGCVCKGTKIWTQNGVLKNIEDLKLEDGIIGFGDKGALKEPIKQLTKPEKKECYRITVEGGNTLECSDDHPILISKRHMDKNIDYITYKVCTFRESKNIKKGDQVAIISEIPIFGKKKEKHARLLGLAIGDGYIGKHGIELSLDSEETYSYIKENYDITPKREFLTKAGYTYRSVYIKGVTNLTKEKGINNKSKLNKVLPIGIDEYDKESLAEFIGGYFDADGYAGITNKGKVRLSLTSISKDLLEGIKYRLLKFGIESNIYKEKITITNIKGWVDKRKNRDKYVLYISRNESILKFAENISFLTKRKQDVLLKIKDEVLKKRSRTKNKKLYVEKDGPNLFNGNKIVDDIKFNVVKKVESIGQQYVYNLTALGTGTYLANNIVTHNTSGNMDKIIESEIIFRDPVSYDFLAFDDEWENKGKIGYFLPAYYTLNQFKDKNGNTNIEAAIKYLQKVRTIKRKSKNQTALLLEMMSRPIKPSEMFIRRSGSVFPTEDLKDVLSDLETSDILLDSSWKARLTIDNTGNVEYANSPLQPLRIFPLKSGDSMNGCIEIFEMPKKLKDGSISSGRYIAGNDPVDDDGNIDTELSLQSTFVLDTWTDRIVAEYTERTQLAEEYYEKLRRLLIFYNAKVNYEQNKKGLYGYFKNHKALHLLAETPQIISDKDIVRTSNIGNKKYGTPNAGTKLNGWGIELMLSWLSKPTFGDDDVPNYRRIRSVGLLKELILYDRNINADRVSAMIMLMIYREDIYETIEGNKNHTSGIDQDKFWDNHFDPKGTMLKKRREKRARLRRLNW